jgi:hypothetical protein
MYAFEINNCEIAHRAPCVRIVVRYSPGITQYMDRSFSPSVNSSPGCIMISNVYYAVDSILENSKADHVGVRGPPRRPTNNITDYYPFVLRRFAPSNPWIQPISRKPGKSAFLTRGASLKAIGQTRQLASNCSKVDHHNLNKTNLLKFFLGHSHS